MTIRYASVCSGIEAATVAWKPLGWSCAWLSEIEKFPCAVLDHHYPDTPNLGDMTRINKDVINDHGRIDLLVGGTPCQSFSVAGLRKGMADPRGNLALVFLGLADAARPRWLVWENVPGVLSSNGGRDFGALLGALGQLGYGFAYRVLDAQYFGVAQRRRRVFVVGYLGDWRRAAAVLLERQGMCGHTPPSREAGKGVAALTANGVGTCGADDNQAQAGHLTVATIDASYGRLQGCSGQDAKHGHSHLIPFGGNNTKGPIDVATAVNACGTASGRMDFESETFIFDTTQITSDKNYSNPKPGDPCHPLAAGAHPPAVTTLAIRGREEESRLEYRTDGTANAILTPNGGAIHSGMAVRRLTPRECDRLQGFPDDYTLIPWRGKPADKCPVGPRYKALGNSMAVPVMRWIGQRIMQIEALGN